MARRCCRQRLAVAPAGIAGRPLPRHCAHCLARPPPSAHTTLCYPVAVSTTLPLPSHCRTAAAANNKQGCNGEPAALLLPRCGSASGGSGEGRRRRRCQARTGGGSSGYSSGTMWTRSVHGCSGAAHATAKASRWLRRPHHHRCQLRHRRQIHCRYRRSRRGRHVSASVCQHACTCSPLPRCHGISVATGAVEVAMPHRRCQQQQQRRHCRAAGVENSMLVSL